MSMGAAQGLRSHAADNQFAIRGGGACRRSIIAELFPASAGNLAQYLIGISMKSNPAPGRHVEDEHVAMVDVPGDLPSLLARIDDIIRAGHVAAPPPVICHHRITHSPD